MPDDFMPQISRVRELIDALDIPVIERPGYEADDVIGSLATHAAPATVSRSSSSPATPTCSNSSTTTSPSILPGARRFGELRHFDREAVVESLRVRPGVRRRLQGPRRRHLGQHPRRGRHRREDGEGPDRAVRHVEEIIAHLDEITPTRARMRSKPTRRRRSGKHLTTIVRDLTIPLDLEQADVGNYDREQMVDLFRELEFRSSSRKLPAAHDGQPKDRQEIERPPRERTTRQHRRESGGDWSSESGRRGRYAIDVETTIHRSVRAELVGIAIAVGPTESFYIPRRPRQRRSTLARTRSVPRCEPLLADPALRHIAHHGKYDQPVLLQHGYALTNSPSRRWSRPISSARPRSG